MHVRLPLWVAELAVLEHTGTCPPCLHAGGDGCRTSGYLEELRLAIRTANARSQAERREWASKGFPR